MQIITYKTTGAAKYRVHDNDTISDGVNHIEVRGSDEYDIGDMKYANATIYQNVTDVPADWVGNKYCYDGATWKANPMYVAP